MASLPSTAHIASLPEWSGDALGYPFTFRSDDPAVVCHVVRLFAGLRGAESTGPPTAFWMPTLGDPGLPGSLTGMAGTINFAAVRAAGRSLLLHAGAVAHADGGTAVLCGPSGSGKSTLTAVLAGRGAAYVTDETACLDPLTLRITPYRKPLGVKPGSFAVLQHLAPRPGSVAAACTSDEMWLVAPSTLSSAPLPDVPLDPRLIVLPTYRQGSAITVERLGEGEAAFLIGENSSQGLHHADRPLEALCRLVRRAPAYRLVHGDVYAAADAVEQLWEAV